MDSSSQSSQRHGWPKSAPPKRHFETSLENPNSNAGNHIPAGYSYELPPHRDVQGSWSMQAQNRKQLRHSVHTSFPSRPTNVTVVKNSRTSLASLVPTNQEIPTNQEKGNRRAVVIAATYKGTQGVSQKCENINHITSLFRLLTVTLNFKRENVWMLTDAPEKVTGCPVKLGATRRNILTSLKWLVGGSKQGDVLFFGFSGLGATVRKEDSHREHISEDCLLPTDYPTSSPIAQTDLASLFAKGLHINASLTALIDTRDCSKVLKLPYIKKVYCVSRAKFVICERAEHEITTGEEKQKETLFTFKYSRVKHEYNRMRRILEKEERDALVSQFSRSGKVFAFGFAGASDSDENTPRRKPITAGALTQAFADSVLQRMKAQKDITYAYVLQSICEAVATKRNSPLPQVASSHGLDLRTSMALVEDNSLK